jgi:hypothetical protein
LKEEPMGESRNDQDKREDRLIDNWDCEIVGFCRRMVQEVVVCGGLKTHNFDADDGWSRGVRREWVTDIRRNS